MSIGNLLPSGRKSNKSQTGKYSSRLSPPNIGMPKKVSPMKAAKPDMQALIHAGDVDFASWRKRKA